MVYSSFGSNTPLLTEQILSAIKLLPYIILTAILTVIIEVFYTCCILGNFHILDR